MHCMNCWEIRQVSDAARLDADDPLKHCRDWFELPEDIVYLDGNSLGPLLMRVREKMQQVVSNEWGERLIRGWNDGWIDLPQQTGAAIASLIGAGEADVICADSVSINLFKCLAVALQVNAGRNEVLVPEETFPTDMYMVQGFRSLGLDVFLRLVPEAELDQHISDKTAAVLVSHVNFKTGRLLDVAGMVKAAHRCESLLILDVSHTVGVVPIEATADEVDFVVGCGYKFLNGGPGAPAFVYVNPKHQGVSQPLSGWMGHKNPFEFDTAYEPAPGVTRYLSGTPTILGMSALSAALTVWEDVNIKEVRSKSLALADFFIQSVQATNALSEVELATPRDHAERGSQVSLRHEYAFALSQALIANGFVGDFREPDILRFGLAPLFNSFQDIERCVQALADLITTEAYLEPRFQQRSKVT